MKFNKKHIVEAFEEVVLRSGFMLIDTEFRGSERNPILEVYIDNEKGIAADNCSFISNQLNSLIELENLIDSDYKLIVSSPGVDRPLKYLAQYHKHLNRKFEVKYSDKDEIREFTGVLSEIIGDRLTFKSAKEEITLTHSQILIAKVVLSF